MDESLRHPDVLDPDAVGSHPAAAKAGGGYVWDEVLEYRVWFSPHRGAKDLADGSDYYFAFSTAQEAIDQAESEAGSEEPLALVLRREYIDEAEQGEYIHVLEERIAEWPLVFLSRPRRTPETIPAFLGPDAPANRLDILRGLA